MGGGGGEDGVGGHTASARDPRGFANVGSFSKLPSRRSGAPPRQSPSSGIRLFGIDILHASFEGRTKEATGAGSTTRSAAMQSNSGTPIAAASAARNSNRKFECHYCSRHFPTSQALGGHQNAHRRDWQREKRVQMQSAMTAARAAAGGAHHHHLLGYPQDRFSATLYPSWSKVSGGAGVSYGQQFYGGIGSVGNPMAGALWRGPLASHGNTGMPMAGARQPVALPVFGGKELKASASLGAASRFSSSSLSLSPQGQFACEQPATTAAAEGVSLDLHL